MSDAGLEALLVMSSDKSIWTSQLPVVPPIETFRLVLHSMGDVRSLETGHIAWTWHKLVHKPPGRLYECSGYADRKI